MRGREDEKKFDDLCDPNWISSATDANEEDVFQRYFSSYFLSVFFLSIDMCPFSWIYGF